MAGTSAPGSRRRSEPLAPGPGPPPGTEHPPSKRARGFSTATVPDPDDPFGAHGDFTADDLEELDTLASQALSQCPAAARDVSSECFSRPFSRRELETAPNPLDGCGFGTSGPALPFRLFKIWEHRDLSYGCLPKGSLILGGNASSRSNSRFETQKLGDHKVHRLDGMSKNPAGKRESVLIKDNFKLEVLQAQYKELKEKMKAMEEEVLIKNGEIKILRDSLHQTESVLEEQRRSHFLLEQEKTQALSDKEKEFSKKLQSLQSELQFKDAEMNELRTKLQSSERGNKLAAPSVSHVRHEKFKVHSKTHSLRGDSIKQEKAQETFVDSWRQRSDTQVLREAQNLAFTGLNLVARNECSHDGDTAEGGRRAFPLCQLPGAVHFLPLVQFFIGLHCQALQDLAAAKRSGAPGDSPTRSSCVSSGVETNPEDSMCILEGFSVTALGLLQHLVCHSGAVVCLLLSGVGADSAAGEGNKSLVHRRTDGDMTSAPVGGADDKGQHPLLKMLLHLLAFSSAAAGHLQASVLSQCLKVLVKLAENTSSDFLPRYKAAQES
ncbi:hypothetical protein P7K49_030361 [Saguinus oedipus]|uniref:ATR-interacting protein n=1 Tax=Saguinus oedipus TaxID=9490 RepID=A0ABQ9U1Y6_SAGOE|nr:hypothetical protein P7K49_030361 [Saguinus oedipus]